MLNTILKTTHQVIRSAIDAVHGASSRISPEIGIDVCSLESRLLYSANPLAALAETASDTTTEITDSLTDDLLMHEDYSDAIADLHFFDTGDWEVVDGRLQVTPNTSDGISLSTLSLDETLPENLEINVTFNADDVSSDYVSNALVIFDYQGPTDFKFAGAYVGANSWIIGHYSSNNWMIDARVSDSIAELTDHDLRVTIVDDSIVTLYANGTPQLTHSYSSSVTDGQLGLGTKNAVSRFDDLQVRSLRADTSSIAGEIPLTEDFNDSLADSFNPELGTWLLVDGKYQVSPEISADGISLLDLDAEFSDHIDIQVTFSPDSSVPQRFSNGVIIFDFQSSTDFKYAGGFVGRNEWVIGQRTSEGWIDNVIVSTSFDGMPDHQMRIVVENDSYVSLFHGDEHVASHTFDDPVTDGALGLGTKNSVTQFDDFSVSGQIVGSDIASDISVEWQGNDLIISSNTDAQVQVIAIENDAFQVIDQGQVVHTIEGVVGNLRIELGDGNDQLVLDMGGNEFEHSIFVNLGAGDNEFRIQNGTIGGHLRVVAYEGVDDMTISDSATIKKHVKVRSGAGEDSFEHHGTIGRSLFVDAGKGDDHFVLGGDVKRSVFARMRGGNDHVNILSSAELGTYSFVNLGDGDDSLDSEDWQRVVVIDRDFTCDSPFDRQDTKEWKRQQKKLFKFSTSGKTGSRLG